MNLPKNYKFLVIFFESLESIYHKKFTWEVIATRLLNEKLMRKEKFGSSKLLIEIAFVLAQKRSKSRISRDKSRDICNYSEEVGHWARECKRKTTNYKNKGEQNNIIEVRFITPRFVISSFYLPHCHLFLSSSFKNFEHNPPQLKCSKVAKANNDT
jgi:hypothetical protein